MNRELPCMPKSLCKEIVEFLENKDTMEIPCREARRYAIVRDIWLHFKDAYLKYWDYNDAMKHITGWWGESYVHDSPTLGKKFTTELFNPISNSNQAKAWKEFWPNGVGMVPTGWHLHHKNPLLKFNDKKRYNEYRVEDLVMLPAPIHRRVHGCIKMIKKAYRKEQIDRESAVEALKLLTNFNNVEEAKSAVDVSKNILKEGRGPKNFWRHHQERFDEE